MESQVFWESRGPTKKWIWRFGPQKIFLNYLSKRPQAAVVLKRPNIKGTGFLQVWVLKMGWP